MLIVVVVHVNTHSTNTSHTRVRMVEPVVVISDIVRTRFTLHTTHRSLTIIPETVVCYSYILRVTLDIYSTITLGLVSSTTLLAIEEIHVVNPYMRVIGIKRHGIIQATHDSKVTELYTLGITKQETKSIYSSIFTDSFKSHVHFRVSTLTLNLQTFCRT